jgi:hypothetical protein
MKRILLLCAMVLSMVPVFGQTATEMLAEIEGKWELDNSGNVTFTRVIEVPGVSKDDLYTRVLSYFTYNYNRGDDIVQIQDKEQGLIVGKGIYSEVHVGRSIATTTVDVSHILRVDIKDGRLRAMISLTEYRNTLHYNNGTNKVATYPVSSRYPITEKRDAQKTVMGKAFYKSYLAAMESLDNLEKSVKEGNTGSESADW